MPSGTSRKPKTVKRKGSKTPVKVSRKPSPDLPREGSAEDLPAPVSSRTRNGIKSIFDLDAVEDPLIGTPKAVQDKLDSLALWVQEHMDDEAAFLRIVQYMHNYILGLVFKKYSFVRGKDEKDMYQEALVALYRKAIPSFKTGKGMSFLNFAKMCMNRHLITILHASINRIRDKPLNTAMSLDRNPASHKDDDPCPLYNVIEDKDDEAPFESMCRSETLTVTLGTIRDKLSPFEEVVLAEYLEERSYRDAASVIRKKYDIPCNEKAIDNALLRIRKKATDLRVELDDDETSLPLLS